jgi:hypothetical protein
MANNDYPILRSSHDLKNICNVRKEHYIFMSWKVFPFIIIYLDVVPIPLENHGKTSFMHILMNLTNEASCPIMLRLHVICCWWNIPF